MAARKNNDIMSKTREKIKTSLLVIRLGKHALADKEIMTASQIRAAEILLRKVLPDTASMQIDERSDTTLTIKWGK